MRKAVVLLTLIFVIAINDTALSGIPTVQGFNADVTGINISPTIINTSLHPTIIGYVKNTSSVDSGAIKSS